MNFYEGSKVEDKVLKAYLKNQTLVVPQHKIDGAHKRITGKKVENR